MGIFLLAVLVPFGAGHGTLRKLAPLSSNCTPIGLAYGPLAVGLVNRRFEITEENVVLPPWPSTRQLLLCSTTRLVSHRSFAEHVHEDRQALVAHSVIFELLAHERVVCSNVRNALFRLASVRLPCFSQLRRTCTELRTDSGQLDLWPSRLQSSFLVHATSSCCSLGCPSCSPTWEAS